MKNNVLFNNEQNKPLAADVEALKLTALLYVKEALQKEQFEDCQRLIAKAKGFGAQQPEISEVIEEYTRGGGHKQPRGGRLQRF